MVWDTKNGHCAIITLLQGKDGGGWLAEIPELPGCMSGGATPDGAFRSILEAKQVWMQDCSRLGRTIPSSLPHLKERLVRGIARAAR